MQFAKLIYNDNIYYVLIVSKLTGHYRYRHIKEDWRTWSSFYAYVFDENEYLKLLNISPDNRKISIKAEISVSKNSAYIDRDARCWLEWISGDSHHLAACDKSKRDVLNKIQTDIDHNRKGMMSNYWRVRLADDNEHIRFQVPDSFSRPPSFKIFERQYFEVSQEDFNKLLMD